LSSGNSRTVRNAWSLASVSEAISRSLVSADLASLPSLGLNPSELKHEWQLDGPDGTTATIPHRPRFATEDMMALRLAALRGIGVSQFPTFVVAGDLNSGRLVDLLPEWSPKAGIIHAVFPSRRGLLPSVRALLDFQCTERSPLKR
jgi:DNA-binding transcriptional LysR family regulator